MKLLVIGSGLMGSALAFDLARSKGVKHITLADVDQKVAEKTAAHIPSNIIRPVALDVNYYDDVVEAMKEQDCTIGAVSYRYNYALTKAAIEAGCHFCDLGGNDEVVAHQRTLHDAAGEAGVSIVPNCGLAPGLANILAARGAELFERVTSITSRVGGLPQRPQPPLNYQLVFSPEGLINEYSGHAVVLRDGAITELPAMTELETIEFPPPFGTLEAFLTSGGTSYLPNMFAGKVLRLDYKTIRYPGHCEKFKTLLELGFASNEAITVGSNVMTEREMFFELLRRKLPASGPDVVLLRVAVVGTKAGTPAALTFDLIDSYDESDHITAMMRTTSYPTSVIAQMLASGTLAVRGVQTPEQCVPLEPLLPELRHRGIHIQQTWQ